MDGDAFLPTATSRVSAFSSGSGARAVSRLCAMAPRSSRFPKASRPPGFVANST